MSYSIDTSALIQSWHNRYPKENFPGFWNKLSELVGSGTLVATEEVKIELDRKADELLKWAEQQNGFFVQIDDDIQHEVRRILQNHKKLLDTRKGRSGADPFVIALAKLRGLTVVTEEGPSRNPIKKPNIPDVCKDLAVKCIRVVDLIKEQGWRF